jgi:SPP1 gp7 family putative phage head morphogenesis protein
MGRTTRDPEVIRVMRGFKRAIEARERRQIMEMATRWLSIERTLEDSIVAAAERAYRVREETGSIPEWRVFQLDRYQSLLRQLQGELTDYGDYATRTVTTGQEFLAQLAIDHAIQAIVTQAPGIAGAFDKLPIQAIQSMVGLAGDGSPLNTLITQSWPTSVNGLTNALIRGTALGWNPEKTAREMKRGMATGLNRALNIARTEQLRVYRETTREQYIQSGVVKGYRRLAARSDRTCAACLMADGQVYELDEHFHEHPSGRCTLIPLVVGTQPINYLQGRDWFRQQDPDTQRKILGPGRYRAWQDGQFELEQLVTVKQNETWGNSLQVTPLRELVN